MAAAAFVAGALEGPQRRRVDLTADETVRQLAPDEAVLGRVPNYLPDPPFVGQFDADPYCDRARDIMPKPLAAIRFYERASRPQQSTEAVPAQGEPAQPAGDDPKTPDPLLAALLAKCGEPAAAGVIAASHVARDAAGHPIAGRRCYGMPLRPCRRKPSRSVSRS